MKYVQFLNTVESLAKISEILNEDICISYLDPNNPVLIIRKSMETPKGDGSSVKYYYKANVKDYIFFDKDNYDLFLLKEEKALREIEKIEELKKK